MLFLKSKVEWWFSKKKRVNNRNRVNKQKKRSNTSKRPLLMLLVLLVWSWNSQSKYYQITKINTLKLTGHASHKDLSTIQINRRGHVYFSLPPSDKYDNCHTLARSVYGWHAQRALLMITSINWKSEVSTKKNEPKQEKRDTAESILVQKSGPALAVLPDRRRRPWSYVLYDKYFNCEFTFINILEMKEKCWQIHSSLPTK